MLKDICIWHDCPGLFNQKNAKVTAYDKKKACKDVRDCVDFFHDTFPHVRYSYTNEYFAHMLGTSVSSVKRSLNKLYQKHILDHRTYTVYGNGRANRQRVLTIKLPIVWDLAT